MSTNAIEILAAGENTNFSNGALLLSENSKIVFNTKDGSAAIYGDDINNGYLVLQNVKSGLRIVNNANNENILIINDDESLDNDDNS